MIRAIVAIDTKRGMANEKGIPWRLPADKAYYKNKVDNADILMGYGTYVADHLKHGQRKYVAIRTKVSLDDGYHQVTDAQELLKNYSEDIWVVGGAGLIASVIDQIDELYVTQLDQDFHCTKFLPDFKKDFSLIYESEPQTENNINFTFQIWKHK